jgi:quinohemoprotein ethanol dehydrogenase
MAIQMADIKIGGVTRQVLMQSPTNGFFYVLDRTNGQLISAEKIGKVTWADHIDLKTGRPVEAANIRYENGPVTIWPGPWGAHNWQPMSFSPRTGLVYIPYQQVGAKYSIDKNAAVGGTVMSPVVQDKDDGKGKLLAWDPSLQKARWSVPLQSLWNGGTLSTAGDLVFQGIEDGSFSAYDASVGRKLWTFNAGLGIIAAPISYLVNGKQYVSILVGYGGATPMGSSFIKGGWKYNAQPRRLLTFAVGAKGQLPATAPRDFNVHPVNDPALRIDSKAAEVGAGVYAAKNCIVCHGASLVSPGSPAPDLRESVIALNRQAFGQLLTSGALAVNGMPAFPELTAEEIDGLYMYVRNGARQALKPGVTRPADSAAHF